jgi:hypothetical protein
LKKKKEPNKLSIHTILPLALLSIILVFAIISIVKLAIWNKGIESVAPTDYTVASLTDDSEDYLVYFTPDEFSQMHSDYVDDGELNIVVIGDESIQDTSDQTGIVQLVSSELKDATIYNLCFPGSQITPKYNPFDISYTNDIVSFYWLSVCIAGKNFDFQTAFWDEIALADETATKSLETMQSIDFSTIDLCIINYNAKEYRNGQKIESLDREDFSMYANAIYQSVKMLQEAYPHMQFVVASPTYCLLEKDGDLLGSEITNSGYGFLPTYMVAAKNASVEIGVSYMDNLLGVLINKDTYPTYLESDGLTLNKNGRMLIANRYLDLLIPTIEGTTEP